MKNLLFITLVSALIFTTQSCKKDDSTSGNTTGTTGKPGITLTAPGSLKLSISHTYGAGALAMSPVSYVTDAHDTIKVTQLTYYISNVTLTTAGGSKVNLGNHTLVEFTPNQNSDIVLQNVPAGTYTSVSYILGVDSAANSTGSHTGDLDPSNGMYWSWSTGYVFVRIKGRFSAQNSSFSFDIGGDNNRMNVSHNLASYQVSGTGITANVKFDVSKIFNAPNLYDLKSDVTDIHSSGAPGIDKLKANMAGAFTVTAVQ